MDTICPGTSGKGPGPRTWIRDGGLALCRVYGCIYALLPAVVLTRAKGPSYRDFYLHACALAWWALRRHGAFASEEVM